MGRTFGEGNHGVRLTQREVAERLGISRARVKQLEDRALRKLARHPDLIRLAVELGVLAREGRK